MTVVAGTSPYPWPFDATIDPERCALVVTGGGELWARKVPDDAVARSLLDQVRSGLARAGMPVLVVVHDVAAERVTAPAGSAPALVPWANEVPVHAAGIDGFYGSALDARLRRSGRTHLLVTGYGLETTVHSTVRRANDRGYECLTVLDSSLAHDPDLIAPARSTIEMSGGIFGAVGTARAVLEAFGTAAVR